jgi:uncharacterized protein with HEPN domain
MDNSKRIVDILGHIVKYCDELFDTQEYFGNSFEVFKSNFIYRNAMAMCILQIGELSGYLPDSFTEIYSGVPWRNIKGMRNIMAHKYGDMSMATVWETITEDVPTLRSYCISILAKQCTPQQTEVKANNIEE